MKKFYPFSSLFFALIFIFLASGGSAQTTIASDGLNGSSTLFTVSGGAFYSNASGTGDRPASTNFYTEGTASFGVTNGIATLTSTSNINTTGYTSISLSVRLASFSIASTGNGADAADNIIIAVSTDGGSNYTNMLQVNGNTNAHWGYSATGVATTAYPTATTVGPAGGGARTTDGYSTLNITSLPATSSLRVRITLLNNTANERWVVDDFKITGTASATPTVAISAGSVSAGNTAQGDQNVILQQFNLAVTDANATFTGLSVTTAGSYTASDISNLKVRYSTDAALDAGDATLSIKTTTLDAGVQTFSSFTQSIASGSTSYIFVTADISPTATAGNTININSIPFSDISFSGTVNKTGIDPVPAGGTKTIVAVTPDVVLSSPNPAVAAGNIVQNTTTNVIYRFDLAVSTANAALTGVTINTAGTYAASDISNIKCWYSSDNSFSAASDVLLSTKTTGLEAGVQTFPSLTTQIIPEGTIGYIFITVDVPCTATAGNTISVNAVTTGDINFTSANESGTASAGDAQTITSATPANVTAPAATAGNAQATVSWTNPSAATCYDEIMIIAAAGAPVDGAPTGDGTAYTANSVYGSGTASGNGFVVYKGTTSPQVVTGLTNGTTYYFKVFTRNDNVWSSGAEVSATPAAQIAPGEVVINQFSPDYSGASDEYVEIVNTTNRPLDLSTLQLRYQAASSSTTSSFGTLSGTLLPHSFWLLSPNATVTVGQTSALSRDGSFTAGMSGTAGQIALVRVGDNTIIDAVGYGSITGSGTYTEGTSAGAPSTDGGLKRVTDGVDNNTNNSDFTTVLTANIYLRNSSSRLANAGASIVSGTYKNLVVTGNSSLAGAVSVTDMVDVKAGTLTTNGSLTLTSTETRTAKVGQVAAGSISGNVTVERFIKDKATRKNVFVASSVTTPISSSWQQQIHITGPGTGGTPCNPSDAANPAQPSPNSNGFDATQTNNPSFFTYNPENSSGTRWTSIPGTGESLTPGVGYRVIVRGARSQGCALLVDANTDPSAVTLSATGTLAQGALNQPIKGSGDRFNLLGNPYPSEIDWNSAAFNEARTSVGLENSYWIYDPTNSAGTYSVYNGGTLTNNTSAISNPNVIAQGQSFFVRKINADNTDGISFWQESMKTTTTQRGLFRTAAPAWAGFIRAGLKTSNGSHLDETVIRFANDASVTNTIGEWDAISINEGNQVIAGIKDNVRVAIQTRPSAFTEDIAPLKVVSSTTGNFRLSFSEFESFAGTIHLKDKFTGLLTDVKANPMYAFSITSDAASQGDNRFELVFKTASVLPVDFINITAVRKAGGIEVNWKVPVENNIAGYHVERSENGRSFTSLTNVASRGNSNTAVSYGWLDKQPAKATGYYRIKATNLSSEYKYSPVVKVFGNAKGSTLSFYPNPVKDVLNVVLGSDVTGTYSVRIMDSKGVQVFTQSNLNAAINVLKINTASLSKGVYMLEIIAADDIRETARFIK